MRRQFRHFTNAASLVFLGLISSGTVSERGFADESTPAKPTSHTERQIEGWTVQVDDRLLLNDVKVLYDRAIRILANRLYEIRLVVPDDKVKRLQTVKIRLDLTHGELTSAQYHPSVEWLKEHGYSEDLAKSVHIPDAASFFSTQFQRDQPWAVMHELAHAYHDQVLSFDHPQITDAWTQFKTRDRYQQVLHIGGTQRPHYASTNPMEFFAEMTETLFGMNDFFPFNRAELAQEEPEIFELMKEIWGQ